MSGLCVFFFFKQKTAYEMRISDWSSDVCSSDLLPAELYAPGNYRYTDGIEAGEALLSLAAPPTAVFCSNDEMAAGLMSVAHGKGIKVPGELSIIGFDDSPTATHIWPALSTVRWPIRDMGIRAAQTLVPDFLGPGAKAAGDESNEIGRAHV